MNQSLLITGLQSYAAGLALWLASALPAWAQTADGVLQKAEVGNQCWLIHTTDGQKLEPVNLSALLDRPEAGLRLHIDYRPAPDMASTCMAGTLVRLSKLVVQPAQPGQTAGHLMTLADGRILAAGVLKPIGPSAHQYGTHQLGGYALRSKKIALKRWEGQKVIITGKPTPGYPVDSGPPLLEVSKIEADQTVRAQ